MRLSAPLPVVSMAAPWVTLRAALSVALLVALWVAGPVRVAAAQDARQPSVQPAPASVLALSLPSSLQSSSQSSSQLSSQPAQPYVQPSTRPTVAGVRSADETMTMVTAEVLRLVPEGAVRDLTLCKLQDGLWGGYDVDVHVTMGVDGLPHLFQLQQGRFSRLVDPRPRGGPSSRFERTGRVQPATAAEAFGRGVPYFILEAVVEKPGVLRLAVLSNPTTTESLGLVLVALDEKGRDADYQSVTLTVEPSPEPQILRLTHDAFGRAQGTARIAILRGVGRSAMVVGCIVSNEVDVALGGG